MRIYLSKWLATMQVTWSNLLVYRLNFVLQTLAPLFVFLVVKLSLWYKVMGDGTVTIKGYDFHQMVSYHLWILISSILVFNSNGTRISEDIRLGRITSYLIYPFQLWEFHGATFLARTAVQLLIAVFTLSAVFAIFQPWFQLPSVSTLIQGLFLVLLAAVFWFWTHFIVGLIGFWLEETWTLMVMLQITAYFLSGSMIPLSLYPGWMQELLVYSPFPYIAYLPAQIFLGASVDLWFAFTVLSSWTLLMILISYGVWKRGMRLYTAAGM